MSHAVREATPDDADDVVRLLDAAMLESDRERVRRRIAAGGVLVAVVAGFGDDTADRAADAGAPSDRVVGACVLAAGHTDASDGRERVAASDTDDCAGDTDDCPSDTDDLMGDTDDRTGDTRRPPVEIEQVAVHRSRRDRGIGTTLVEAAASRTDGPLVARFREQVRPFYESTGFEIRDGDTSDDSDHDASDHDTSDGSDHDTSDNGDGRLYGVFTPSDG